MSTPSPAYAYGQTLRAIRDAYVRMFRDIAAGFNGTVPRELTEDELEARRILRYQALVAEERRIGLSHVRRVARDARRDLGLS